MSYAGMDSKTGKAIDGLAHLRQSVVMILTTPIGSRVMRRDFGSRLYELLDRNITQSLKMQIYAAVVEALQKWEPRLKINRVTVDPINADDANKINLSIDGIYLPDGRPITLDGVAL